MHRNYFLALVALALLSLFMIFVSLWREIDTPVTKEPLVPPPRGPYPYFISGVGVIEPSSGNIAIGTPLNRIVDKVVVKVGDKVNRGDPLFFLENRDLKAQMNVQKAAYQSALSKLKKLEALPRAEDLASAEAALNSAKVELQLAKDQYEMILSLPDPRAVSQEDKNRRLFSYRQAESKELQARAEYEKTKAGMWKPDFEIAGFEVAQAEASMRLANTEIQRTIIRAPIDGTILQVKIHEGEFPSADPFRLPSMILGDIEELYLRVSIDQLNISYFRSDAPAAAFLQGDSKVEFPLEFVRIEPVLIDKQNLTNEITEKVDTRVFQIIYKIKSGDYPLYIGERMDVYIESKRVHGNEQA